jgi:Signal transduction histidine kinase
VSADNHTLLDEAQQLVSEQLNRLRELVQQAQQRSAHLTNAQRQAERALDEAIIQHQFARQHQQANADSFAKREAELRANYDQIVQESQSTAHALKQLDQLVRQIEMSSSVLLGGSTESKANDPWMLALRAQVIQGREEERTRLAREVHDGPAQVLANTLMGLEQCVTLIQQQNTERLALMLDRMRSVTREGLHEVRRFISDLRPGRLSEQGLLVAIQDYVRRYQDTTGAQVTLNAALLPRLANDVEIVLYRIVQEALQNVSKHARSAAVHISLGLSNDTLILKIQDNGPGFNPREVARRAGRESWGLTSMRERAELIGAQLTVASRLNHGTTVTVVLPLR